jgi:hypothetical protein
MLTHSPTFLRYLMTTALLGGSVGIAHGVARTMGQPPERRLVMSLQDGLTGSILIYYTPLAAPYLLVTGWRPPAACQWPSSSVKC